MPSKKLSLYFQTLKHVKPTQLYHQLYYRLKNRFFKKSYQGKPEQVVKLRLKSGILYPNSYSGNKKFSFLNLEKSFSVIDWNFSEFGKLWAYNLNYFEFLNQEKITGEQGRELIQDYISKKEILKDGFEPYPISLRGINWIKFLAKYRIEDQGINEFLYANYLRLTDNLEYHLLANHLLENGFSLLFGAYYFQDEILFKKAYKILIVQLEEQILEDGAHYELSPMYHQIILHRVLDCLNLIQNNKWKADELKNLLHTKAENMLVWLEAISFINGEIPKLNDSIDGIAPNTRELLTYAAGLGLKSNTVKLKDSGYRKFEFKELEILMDVGQIAPKYQPGHSHSDSLQFLLNYKNKPVIVDTGISTYEKNERRQLERSTGSHNTVTINDQNSSEVWGGFRVARRAKVSIFNETATLIEASHNGYRKLGFTHGRIFSIEENTFRIEDKILQDGNKSCKANGYLHFHPDTIIEIKGNSISINEELRLEISGADQIELGDYKFAEGFNKIKAAKKLVYTFKHKVILEFHSASEAKPLRPLREKTY